MHVYTQSKIHWVILFLSRDQNTCIWNTMLVYQPLYSKHCIAGLYLTQLSLKSRLLENFRQEWFFIWNCQLVQMQKFQQCGVIFLNVFPDFSSPVNLGWTVTKHPGAQASQMMGSWQFPGFVNSSDLRSAAFRLRLWSPCVLQFRNYML